MKQGRIGNNDINAGRANREGKMSRDATFIPELRITVPARRDSIVLLRHVVRGFRDGYPIDADRMDDIVLAVSEAATNVVVHAYGTRRGTVTVFAAVEDGSLRVLVRDHGIGISRADQRPAQGHGLSLMQHVSTSMEIVGSASGTDVLMSFSVMGGTGDDGAIDDLGDGP